MTQNSINLVSLDFDELKSQFKQFLKSKAKFKDYDFEGSNINVLLDLLSYNTYLNAFYLNMVSSEMFIDSAQLKSSIISIAKALNYLPGSAQSSVAKLDLKFARHNLNSFTIPQYTRFTAKNSKSSYQFLTTKNYILYPEGNFFIIKGLEVYEGKNTTEAFIMDYETTNQKFILNNVKIDINSIDVKVVEDNNYQNQVTYKRKTNLYDVKSDDEIFFVNALSESRYEILFGDNIFGKKPKNGALILVTYRITNGADGNDCTNFVLNDNLGTLNGHSSAIVPEITVVEKSKNGAEAETIEQIRYRAPIYYQTRERAVTKNDYSILITKQFPKIKNVQVFGGEETFNTRYGKVFISPVTYSGENLSYTEKQNIIDFIKDKNIIAVEPVVVDPEYLYIYLNVEVIYDKSKTSKSSFDIESLIKDEIIKYNDSVLNDFNKIMSITTLKTNIKNEENAIEDIDINIKLRKLFISDVLKNVTPTINFYNEITPGTISTSQFIENGRTYEFTDYNPNKETFYLQRIDENTVKLKNSVNTLYKRDVSFVTNISYQEMGIVDYENGIVYFPNILPVSFKDNMGLEVIVGTSQNKVFGKENNILFIDINNSKIIAKSK